MKAPYDFDVLSSIASTQTVDSLRKEALRQTRELSFANSGIASAMSQLEASSGIASAMSQLETNSGIGQLHRDSFAAYVSAASSALGLSQSRQKAEIFGDLASAASSAIDALRIGPS